MNYYIRIVVCYIYENEYVLFVGFQKKKKKILLLNSFFLIKIHPQLMEYIINSLPMETKKERK